MASKIPSSRTTVAAPHGIKGPDQLQEKRGRGRPPKDPNAPPKEKTELAHNFRAAVFIASIGGRAELIKRSHDNSEAQSLVEIGGKTFLLVENADNIGIFTLQTSCKRSAISLLKALEKQGVSIEE